MREKSVDKKRCHRRHTQSKRSTIDCSKLVSQMLRGPLGQQHKTVAQFRYMTDSQYEATSHLQSWNTMFVHMVVEACRRLQQERGLFDGTRGQCVCT